MPIEQHIMVDIETWGTEPGLAIRSVAALDFSQLMINRERIYAMQSWDGESLGGPLPVGFHYGIYDDRPKCIETVEFWEGHPLASERIYNLPHIGPDKLLEAFTHLIDPRASRTYWWARSPDFDMRMLDAYKGLHFPWTFRNLQDVRTTERLGYVLGIDTEWGGRELIPHDALHDCVKQVNTVALVENTCWEAVNKE